MVIPLPDIAHAFEYEKNFHLSCDITRISKILAHYELYRRIVHLPGVIIECGVFKGLTFTIFSEFRELLDNPDTRKIIGFDTFADFPETSFQDDKQFREDFIKIAGNQSISKDQLISVLKSKNIYRNIELVEGDIIQTLPEYVQNHPELQIALLNLDTDLYEPAVTILKCLYPRIVDGGILLLDDYGVTVGETKAVDDYFTGKMVKLQRLPFRETPWYIVKDRKNGDYCGEIGK
jgi:hypothetical protein